MTEGETYDPEPRRETTRSRLAYGLIALLAAVGLSLIAFAAFHKLKIDDAKDLAAAIFSPLIGVTGAVFGFYFSGHRSNK